LLENPPSTKSGASNSNGGHRILPLLTLLVLCSFLDRTNVGNAKLYNLEADLHMANNQYNSGLAAFYPFYIAMYVPRQNSPLAYDGILRSFMSTY